MSESIFYIDESGEKKDAELHQKLLKSQELNWSGSSAQVRAIDYAVKKLGKTLEEAKRAYA